VNQSIYLKPGREKSILLRHPWIFSGAIARTDGTPEPGETVVVRSATGEGIAKAAYSPHSSIRARVWSFDPLEEIDAAFLHRKLIQAIELRNILGLSAESNAFRLVYGESDGIPGVVVDQYGDVLALQLLSTGAEAWRDSIVTSLIELTGAKCIIERSDVDVRELEGLAQRKGIIYGNSPEVVHLIEENGLLFPVDVLGGQKTGFYLDQRRNRQRVRALAQGRKVLNCFSYSCGFSVYSLAGKAEQVLSVDSSNDALNLGGLALSANGIDRAKHEFIEADVFQALRKFRDSRQTFDMIILDPPKFAPTVAQAERATRGYKDINLLAFKLLRPHGLLVTFSCSGGISADLFQKIVTGAALDAGVDAKIVETLNQAPDHPVALNFPEGAYLKGLICIVG